MQTPLPTQTRNLIDRYRHATHPGLLLDKYAQSWQPGTGGLKFSEAIQTPTINAVVQASEGPPEGLDFQALLRRRNTGIDRLQEANRAKVFTAITTSPLTLYLSRASLLENAGLSLHPIYGFTYLPGTSLKGLTRAFAETVWFPSQYKASEEGEPIDKEEFRHAEQAWRRIEDVFGWAPNSDSNKTWKPKLTVQRVAPTDAAAGSIIFHDAWPTKWPVLQADLVNNHHQNYYGAGEKDTAYAPDDAETPVMISFLTVKSGAEFSFAVSGRRDDAAMPFMTCAHQWLVGALTYLSLGAKTNAGYGAFRLQAADVSPISSPRHRVFETTLELGSPAFLAGADQYDVATCDLRSATLRGLLRGWWRTLHAGFVDVAWLRRLESALWGSTQRGGAIQINLVAASDNPRPEIFRKRDIKMMNREEKSGDYGIPNCDSNKTTQGLWYAAYGMDEQSEPRPFIAPGAKWGLKITARASRFDHTNTSLPASMVCEQAKIALWLLCQYGGVGAKNRKGFGSLLADGLNHLSLEVCQKDAQTFRDHLKIGQAFTNTLVTSPALGNLISMADVTFAWSNPWDVVDQVGFAYQAFAKRFSHDMDKKKRLMPTWSSSLGAGYTKASLGLPRQLHGPRPNSPQPVQYLHLPDCEPKDERSQARFASPVHIRVVRHSSGITVRAVSFPASRLPSLGSSRQFLQEFMNEFERDINRRAKLADPGRSPTPTLPTPLIKGNTIIETVLLEEKTKKGGWRALHEPTGLSGHILNSARVPNDKQSGDRVALVVAWASVDAKNAAFQWPDQEDKEQKDKSRPRKGAKRKR